MEEWAPVDWRLGQTDTLLIQLTPLCTILVPARLFWSFVCGFVPGESFRRWQWVRRGQTPALCTHKLQAFWNFLIMDFCALEKEGDPLPLGSSLSYFVPHWNCKGLALKASHRFWSESAVPLLWILRTDSCSLSNSKSTTSSQLGHRKLVIMWFCVCPAPISF